MQRSLLSAATAAWIVAASGAFTAAGACGSGNVLFEDKLTAMPSWIGKGSNVSAGPGGLRFTETENAMSWNLPPGLYRNYDVCVTVSAQATDDASAGLVFLLTDNSNYYTVLVDNIFGNFSAQRLSAGQWNVLIPWTAHPAVRKGATAENQVRVQIDDGRAHILINGDPAGEIALSFAYVDATGGTYTGIVRSNYPNKTPSTFVFKNFELRETQN